VSWMYVIGPILSIALFPVTSSLSCMW
jgi:hypothetical protein